jgi:Mycothiol maleylpyruvate isomerase N-terminal domain
MSQSVQSERVIDELDDAAEEMRRAIAGSLSTKLDVQSPCEGWTVRDVINHVVTGNLARLRGLATRTGRGTRRTTLPEILWGHSMTRFFRSAHDWRTC